MRRGLIVPCTRTRRSIAQLSVSVPSNNIQFSVDFTTNIAESNFWYTQPQNNQLMPEHRILCLKPALRLEWRGQNDQDKTEQSEHGPQTLGDSFG
jgi:hypothetical protein